MLSKRLAAFGLSREYLTTHNPTPSQIAETIMGMSVDAKVIQRPYQDEMRNDVDMFFPASGATGVPAAPTVAGAPPMPVVPSEEEMTPTAPPVVAEVPVAPVAPPEAAPSTPPLPPTESPF